MFAHYTAISKFETVTITRTPSLQYGDNRVAEIVVSGKAEARKVAAEHGARCWNF
jgi:hypothetical protein